MYKIQSHVPVPTLRREYGSPTASEAATFSRYVAAYRHKYGCTLLLGTFDSRSRVQVFIGPTFVLAHTPRRCKELMKGLR